MDSKIELTNSLGSLTIEFKSNQITYSVKSPEGEYTRSFSGDSAEDEARVLCDLGEDIEHLHSPELKGKPLAYRAGIYEVKFYVIRPKSGENSVAEIYFFENMKVVHHARFRSPLDRFVEFSKEAEERANEFLKIHQA